MCEDSGAEFEKLITFGAQKLGMTKLDKTDYERRTAAHPSRPQPRFSGAVAA